MRPFFVVPPTSAKRNFPKPRAETVSPSVKGLSALVHSIQFTCTRPEDTSSAAFPRDMRSPAAITASSRNEETVSRTSSVDAWGTWMQLRSTS